MPQVQANGISIEYEAFGAASAPLVLLIMGLGAQLTRWPAAFCDQLAAHGFRVVRFDNRDVGRSTHLTAAPVPDLGAVLAMRSMGLPVEVPYKLRDMAADTVALLDALQVERAHIVGASMGGMIAQIVASEFPQRVLSLTSIMSTTGNPMLPPPSPAATAVLMTRAPDPKDQAAYLAHSLNALRTLSSPGYPFDEAAVRERVLTDLGRGYNPAGYLRQITAVSVSGDRREQLKRITAPTVVLHGADDPLVPIAAGRDTAATIPNAELRVVPGMGHDLPVPLYDTIIDAIVSAARRAAPVAG